MSAERLAYALGVTVGVCVYVLLLYTIVEATLL